MVSNNFCRLYNFRNHKLAACTKTDSIKQKIINGYKNEISLNTNLIDIPRGIEVLNSIPEQLRKDNKKFQYGLMGTGKRAKEYESTINYLVNNQILYRSYKIQTVKSPLSSCREKDSFKLSFFWFSFWIKLIYIYINFIIFSS